MGVCLSVDPLDEEDEEEQSFRKPYYYRHRDGPRFRVLNYTTHYEYRQYEKSTWISARLEGEGKEGKNLNKTLSKGEKILGRYFNGKNGPEKVMDLTCPLKLRVEFGKPAYGPWSNADAIVSLHLPYDNESRPPAPLENGLFIEEVAEHFAYVKTFEGFATEEIWHDEVIKLRRILDGEGQKCDRQAFFVTRYENLLHLGTKRNEVIIVVQPERPKES